MGTVNENEKKPVRGILVASDFHDQVIIASKILPNVLLKEYCVNFLFKNR